MPSPSQHDDAGPSAMANDAACDMLSYAASDDVIRTERSTAPSE